MKIEFTFRDPTFEGQSVDEKFDLLLGIAATFELVVNDAVVYEEVMFPIAELRVALLVWLVGPMLRHEDFEFESMESEERGLVWIRWSEKEGWLVGSVLERYREPHAFSDDDIRDAVKRFASGVDRWATTELRVKLPDHL